MLLFIFTREFDRDCSSAQLSFSATNRPNSEHKEVMQNLKRGFHTSKGLGVARDAIWRYWGVDIRLVSKTVN
jgi:hypothetical protein